MEVSHPIAESLHDKDGRPMVLRVNSARQYDATAMAAGYADKRLDKYWDTKDAVDVLDAVSRLQGIPVSKLKMVVNTGPKHLHGTWVHEDVALHLAAWLSKDFYAFMLQTFRRYIRGEITTEESKAAKKALDARHKQDQIKCEQLQQQLTATQKDNKQYSTKVISLKRQADELQTKLDKTKKKETKKSRAEDKFEFVKRLREAIKLYVADRTLSFPEAEEGFGFDKDGSPMTIPKFVQALEDDHKNADGLGKDWSLFNETPGQGWNMVPLTQAIDDRQSVEDFCKHTNFTAGFNHPDRKKVLQEIGDEMFVALPSNKRARRG